MRYELGFYIPEDGILHGHCRENLESYLKPKKTVDIPHSIRFITVSGKKCRVHDGGRSRGVLLHWQVHVFRVGINTAVAKQRTAFVIEERTSKEIMSN
jgi:hypothetical protein